MALQYTTHEPTSKIELSISCKDLPRMDVTSKSDPFVVLFEDAVQVGMTEVIKDNQNPHFQHSFVIKYYFERSQKLCFRIYDCDSFSDVSNFSKQELIGEINCEVGDIIGSRGQTLEKPIQGKKANLGTIRIVAEEVKANSTFSFQNDSLPQPLPQTYEEFEIRQHEVPPTVPKVEQTICFSCSATNLDKKDLFGKSDPYIKIYRFREDSSGEPAFIFESPVEKKTLNPTWPSFEISMQKLCNNDPNRTLLFEIWDWDRHTSHDLIGKFQTTLNQILNENKQDFLVVHPKKLQEKKKYENSGVFHFVKVSTRLDETSEPNPLYTQWMQYRAQLLPEYSFRTGTFVPGTPNPFSFMDYLKSGCELSVMFGIDFTASNQPYTETKSLHHLSSHPNPYQQAIEAVGHIVAPYDHDQTFPVFGYGARVSGQFPPMFNVNFTDNPECFGIQGVLEAYRECVPKISFGDMGSAKHPIPGQRYYGDDFYPLIERAVEESKKYPIGTKYFVILLIIDGDYFDDQTTIDKIIEAEDYPVSLIIVGVGGNRFSHCQKFDADDEPLFSSTGRKQARDIVQFVPMNRFKDDPSGLAAEVLAEVPHQLTSFMAAKRISPKMLAEQKLN